MGTKLESSVARTRLLALYPGIPTYATIIGKVSQDEKLHFMHPGHVEDRAKCQVHFLCKCMEFSSILYMIGYWYMKFPMLEIQLLVLCVVDLVMHNRKRLHISIHIVHHMIEALTTFTAWTAGEWTEILNSISNRVWLRHQIHPGLLDVSHVYFEKYRKTWVQLRLQDYYPHFFIDALSTKINARTARFSLDFRIFYNFSRPQRSLHNISQSIPTKTSTRISGQKKKRLLGIYFTATELVVVCSVVIPVLVQ